MRRRRQVPAQLCLRLRVLAVSRLCGFETRGSNVECSAASANFTELTLSYGGPELLAVGLTVGFSSSGWVVCRCSRGSSRRHYLVWSLAQTLSKP